jgi:hypothetical protein
MTRVTTDITSPADGADQALLERLRAATELLESIADERGLLDRLPAEARERLHQAVARVYHPDPVVRRRKMKAAERERRAAEIQREETVLHGTGIRALRRRPVFTTPNVFPPRGFEPRDVERDETERREALEPQHCYVCKQKYSVIHHFYDQLCPSCAELNFRKRTELADLKGRVALLTGGRVKIGYAIRQSVTPRNRISASGDTAWRSSVSTCAIRRAWRHSAGNWSRPASAWTSSSTTRARRCAARRISTRT